MAVENLVQGVNNIDFGPLGGGEKHGTSRLKRFRLAPVVLVRGRVAEVAGFLDSPGLVAAEVADVDRSAYPFGGSADPAEPGLS